MKAFFYYTLAALVMVLSFLFSGLTLLFALVWGTRREETSLINGGGLPGKMDDDDPVWI